MERNIVTHKLSNIFRKVFKDEVELNESTSAKDIKSWDSLNHVILIKQIEEEFHIEFDLFDMIELKTFGDIVNYIQEKQD